MAELKTRKNPGDVKAFLAGIVDARRKKDSHEVCRLMQKLGKYQTGKPCLYIKKLDDIDRGVLEDLVRQSVAHMRKKYPST